MNYTKNLLSRYSSAIKGAPSRLATYVSDLAKKSPHEVQPKLNSIFNFKFNDPANKASIRDAFTGAGKNLGALNGGAAGAIANPDLGLKNEDGSSTLSNRLANTLLGGLTGRAAGGLLGRKAGILAPEALPKMFGRIVTNVGYPGISKGAPKSSLRDMVKAVWHDRPLKPLSEEDHAQEFVTRRMFNLQPRFGADQYAKQNASGKFNLNTQHPAAKSMDAKLRTTPVDDINSTNVNTDKLKDIISSNSYKTRINGSDAVVDSKGRFSMPMDQEFAVDSKTKFNTPENVAKGFANMFSRHGTDTLEGMAQTPADLVKGVSLSKPGVRGTIQSRLANKITPDGNNTDIARELLTKSHLGDASRDSRVFNADIHKRLLAASMRNPKFDLLEHLARLQSTRGTGNSLSPSKRWRLGSNKVRAFGMDHEIDTLRGPTGKPWSGPGLGDKVKKNLSGGATLSPAEKSNIVKRVFSQDPDFAKLYKTDPYIKSELDKEIHQEIIKHMQAKNKFIDPNIVSKQDLQDVLGFDGVKRANIFMPTLKRLGSRIGNIIAPKSDPLAARFAWALQTPGHMLNSARDVLRPENLLRTVPTNMAAGAGVGIGGTSLYDYINNRGDSGFSMSDKLKMSLALGASPTAFRLLRNPLRDARSFLRASKTVSEAGFSPGEHNLKTIDKLSDILRNSQLSAKDKAVAFSMHGRDISNLFKPSGEVFAHYFSNTIRPPVSAVKSLSKLTKNFGYRTMNAGHTVNAGLQGAGGVVNTDKALGPSLLDMNSDTNLLLRKLKFKRVYGTSAPPDGPTIPFDITYAQ